MQRNCIVFSTVCTNTDSIANTNKCKRLFYTTRANAQVYHTPLRFMNIMSHSVLMIHCIMHAHSTAHAGKLPGKAMNCVALMAPLITVSKGGSAG